MNKLKLLICMVFATMALAACSVDDNPVDSSTTVNIDNPQDNVTDQPANAR